MRTSALEKLGLRLKVHADDVRPRVFLVLSGSFNPLHTQHVQLLHLAKTELERRGWIVVGGFLAPSSQEYVDEKLRDEAWPLRFRVELCELATNRSDWLDVWPVGEMSGFKVVEQIRQRIATEYRGLVNDRELLGAEVMGSETTIRILDKVLARWRAEDPTGSPWYDGRIVCSVVRPGPESGREAKHIRDVTAPAIARAGVQVILVEAPQGLLRNTSSSAIRRLIASSAWERLRASDDLDPRVCTTLEARNDRSPR